VGSSWKEYLQPAAVALLGVALIVDGARRALGGGQLKALKTAIADGSMALHNVTKLVIARTLPQLRDCGKARAERHHGCRWRPCDFGGDGGRGRRGGISR
jgi:hypothetical protein